LRTRWERQVGKVVYGAATISGLRPVFQYTVEPQWGQLIYICRTISKTPA